MQILCVYKGRYPDGMARANRLACYARALHAEKIPFTVATEGTPPTEDACTRTLFDGHTIWHWRRSHPLDRIPFIRGFYSSFKRFNLYARIWRDMHHRVVFSAGYDWPQLLLLAAVCRLRGKALVLELNELPHSIRSSRLQTSWTNRVHRRLAFALAFPLTDGFLTISEPLRTLSLRHARRSAKAIKIPILTNSIPTAPSPAPSSPTSASPAILFHAGTLTPEKDGIFYVFQAVAIAIRDHGVNLRFVLSNRTALPHILAQIDDILDANDIREQVTFHNHLSDADLAAAYRSCTMVVINKPDTIRNRHNFATKLGECMSYGLPIITTAVGESAAYLTHGQNALIIRDSESPEEIASHMLTLLNDPALAARLGQNARATAAAHFHYSRHQRALAGFFRSF